MRRVIVFGVLLVLWAAAGAAAVEPSIRVTEISPQPADPGDAVTVFVTVENAGETDATFDPVGVEAADGLTVTGATGSFTDRFELCGGCQVAGTYYLTVADGATSGSYPVTLRLQRDGSGVAERTTVDVDGTPRLSVDVPHTRVGPGGNASLTVAVTNTGTGAASGTTATLDGDGFALYPTSLRFGDVAPGETVTRAAVLETDKDRAGGLARLGLSLRARDGSATVTEDASFSVGVIEQAALAVADVSLDAARVGSPVTATVQLENLGPGEATRIRSMLSCDGADVRRGEDFVGQLDDAESVPVTFQLVPEASSASCTVSASYEDSQPRTVEESFTVAASQRRSPLPVVVAVVVVVAAGAAVWRRRRNNAAAEV